MPDISEINQLQESLDTIQTQLVQLDTATDMLGAQQPPDNNLAANISATSPIVHWSCSDSPIVHWSCSDSPFDTVMNDDIGGLNGVYVGSVSKGVAGISNTGSYATHFTEKSQAGGYAYVAADAKTKLYNDSSFSLIFRIPDTIPGDIYALATRWGSGAENWHFDVRSYAKLFFIAMKEGGGDIRYSGSTNMDDGLVHMLNLTVDHTNSIVRLYLDNVEIGTWTSTRLTDTMSGMRFGRYLNDTNHQCSWMVYHSWFNNKVLSPAEISAIWGEISS